MRADLTPPAERMRVAAPMPAAAPVLARMHGAEPMPAAGLVLARMHGAEPMPGAAWEETLAGLVPAQTLAERRPGALLPAPERM